MRLLNNGARAALSLAFLAALSACGVLGGGDDAVLADSLPVAQTGPAADYPVVVGQPYIVDGVLFTPVDTLNHDEVGYASLDGRGGDTVSAAHHTLPLPSYVEVTSLATGRTILVRVERRGPMDSTDVIALSPGAYAQLGATGKAPVRVRRVNPPEPERAALRLGGRASDRLETPETLLAVLRRKLPGEGSAAPAAAAPAKAPETAPVPAGATTVAAAFAPPASPKPTTPAAARELPPFVPLVPLAPASTPNYVPVREMPAPVAAAPARATPKPAAAPVAAPKPPRAAPQPVVATNGAYIVQAGAFSTSDRAQKVANAIGGSVSKSGKLFRVRTGPFASRASAEASLAKVRAAGYSEARIFTNG